MGVYPPLQPTNHSIFSHRNVRSLMKDNRIAICAFSFSLFERSIGIRGLEGEASFHEGFTMSRPCWINTGVWRRF